jgi:hypothetical protein
MAERQGFEPWNTREDVTGIPVQRLRPLGHLSKTFVRFARSLFEGDPDWNRPARYSARPVLQRERRILSAKLNSGRLNCFQHLALKLARQGSQREANALTDEAEAGHRPLDWNRVCFEEQCTM